MSNPTNYYKAVVGTLASGTLRQACFAFDDGDPEDARAALGHARNHFPAALVPEVSVWKRSAVVPGHVPQIGVNGVGDAEEMKGAA